jgi:hypothetical protein
LAAQPNDARKEDPVASRASNPLTRPREIAANQRGQLTKRQRSRLGNVVQEKVRQWQNVTLASLFPTFAPLAVVLFVPEGPDPGNWAVWLSCAFVALFCLWFVPAVLMYLRWRRRRRYLERAPVAHGVGSVYWRRKSYVIALGDEGKKLDPIHTPDLLPGRYRLHYLPRFLWLLSAERLEEVSQPDGLEQLKLALAQAHHLETAALDTNRSGQLTASQRAKLLLRYAAGAMFGFAVAGLFLYVVGVFRISEYRWIPILIVVGVSALTLSVLRQYLGSPLEYLQGQVLVAEGVVTKVVEMSLNHEYASVTASYYYRVNKLVLPVNEAGYEALIDGLEYRLYYLPRSRKLVNVEVSTDQVLTGASA